MNKLKGKVAIVTGASKGIGAAIAKGLAEAGAAVAVNYCSSKEGADRTVAEITNKGGKAIAIKGDVGKAADVKRLFEETEESLGSPSVLVNNAGVFQFGPVEAISEKEFHREFDANVLGPILTIQEAVKPWHWPRSLGDETYASTQWRRVTRIRKARGDWDSSTASRLSRWSRKPRWLAGSGNPTRSRQSLCSWLRTMRPG